TLQFLLYLHNLLSPCVKDLKQINIRFLEEEVVCGREARTVQNRGLVGEGGLVSDLHVPPQEHRHI
ncbi:hypothetical protein NP245_24025, partial [Salmonella enterica]|nr:hypothetical protein [Salmonella enterica]